MSPRGWQDRIRDILDAIAEIQRFTRGVTYEAFRGDDKSIRAVEMNFIIIGEAANQIPEEIEEKYPEIPWRRMAGMRHLQVRRTPMGQSKTSERTREKTVQRGACT